MQRPVGPVKPGVDLVMTTSPVLLGDASALKTGEFVVKNLYLSLDPAMRGWMNDAKSYIAPVELGAVMRGGCVGEIVASNNDKYRVGTLVSGMTGWQEFSHVQDPKGIQVLPDIPGIEPQVCVPPVKTPADDMM